MKHLKFIPLLLWLTFSSSPFAQGARETQTQPGEVLIMLSSDSGIYEEGLAGIRSVIQAPVTVVYLNVLRAEGQNLGEYFRRLNSSRFRLFVAIGGPAAAVAYSNKPRIPIIFSMLNSPKSLPARPGRLCGVSMNVPMEEYFKVLKEIAPEVRRVHSLYSTEQGAYLAGEGDYIDLRHGLIYTKEQLTDPSLFEERLERLRGRVHAFYMVFDALYNPERFRILSKFAAKNKMILMTPFRTLVRSGATFALEPNYSRIGVFTGDMANRLLTGKSDCTREGIRVPDRSSFFFYLNEDYARRAGFVIPQAIRRRASNVRLFRAGLEFYTDGKYKSALLVFRRILQDDPSNSAAEYYRDLVLEKVSGARIAELKRVARTGIAQKEYTRARRAYREMLLINARYAFALRGLRNLSELEREEANNLHGSGRPFAAIRLMQGALTTNPNNALAARDLATIRRRERRRVSSLLSSGRNWYTRRNYARSIAVFGNVLLISPGNKQAREYLRLSRKKQAAIRRLEQKIRRANRRAP